MQIDTDDYAQLQRQIADIATRYYTNVVSDDVRPSDAILTRGRTSLHPHASEDGKDTGIGAQAAIRHIADDVIPAIGRMNGSRFFGFVTGGATPAAQAGDTLASILDHNVQVHLPDFGIATFIEDHVLRSSLGLLKLNEKEWKGRTLTTGATASNILGLACGRNAVLGRDVGELGFNGRRVEIHCAAAHASTRKAASVVGIGRANCIEVVDGSDAYGVAFDMAELERRLAQGDHGKIVVASFGEVNTGLFTGDLQAVRRLCDKHGAWLHIDAAFAVFAGLHPRLSRLLDGLELADSITCDAHKWLNVPYDCGIFFTRRLDVLKDVCSGGDAPYLSKGGDVDEVSSPLNVGLENSRRFRALPLYTHLVAYGRAGLVDIVTRNLVFARQVDVWLRTNQTASAFYKVLTPSSVSRQIGDSLARGEHEMTNILLFTTTSTAISADDVAKHINDSGKCYVTATTFRGARAIRLAVSNWRTGLPHENGVDDFGITTSALLAAAQHFSNRSNLTMAA